jgi:hypothetical protein
MTDMTLQQAFAATPPSPTTCEHGHPEVEPWTGTWDRECWYGHPITVHENGPMTDMTLQQALAELQRTALMQPPPSVAVEALGVLARHIEELEHLVNQHIAFRQLAMTLLADQAQRLKKAS